MRNRPRSFAVLIQNDCILMVRIVNGLNNFWTLPGGEVEEGETFEEAAIREVQEEVNLKVKVAKYLYTSAYEFGVEKCFLVEVIGQDSTPTLGYDPELPKNQQELKEVKWHLLKEMVEDQQVSEVIKALGLYV
ncbi:NUDIX hydrolase [Rossellomorea sp. DA94]|uniref:NUDIX hydrolase n=1 Tax=Rossellomorea sp. DA94 TaxID=3038653 RepID=UPI00244825A3|nr:NUDIX hydrolase [Rossellomorea sp. DA94]WGG46516.1 NUDIX hydrolase [Rossellomorea sp. DA94]